MRGAAEEGILFVVFPCKWAEVGFSSELLCAILSTVPSVFSIPVPAKRTDLSRVGGGLSCPGVVTCIKIAWASQLAFLLSLFQVCLRAVWFCLFV